MKVYSLRTVMYNSTITMYETVDLFATHELALEVKEHLDAIDEKNSKNSQFEVRRYVDEVDFYINREDVPCLNQENNE